MKKYKEIAKYLGISLPACVISLASADSVNAKSAKNEEIDPAPSNEVVSFLADIIENNSPQMGEWIVHSDSHSNYGGNHADRHSNSQHSDRHANTNARESHKQVRNPDGTTSYVPYCVPHSNSHTNRNPINQHTNSGNSRHTDKHTNRDTKFDC